MNGNPEQHSIHNFSFLATLLSNFSEFYGRTAFFIQGKHYSYHDLKLKVIQIQSQIENEIPESEKYIALAVHDDIETYAAIFAMWFLGKAYVPINGKNPSDRNLEIIKQVDLKFILDSDSNELIDFPLQSINTKSIISESFVQEIICKNAPENDDVYLLFTSGSTGKPKGVRIGMENLNAFIINFYQSFMDIGIDDRFLQLYDLSFDASVRSFCLPLVYGASSYTVPNNVIKYLYAYELMLKYDLSIIAMPPSTLNYLSPFFETIYLPKIKYSLFGGEAFSENLAREWAKCVPDAHIINIYGPTEATINTHFFNWNPKISHKKHYRGVISIGKCFGSNEALIMDKNGKVLGDNEKGELCLGGNQISCGYWKDDEKTKEAFINFQIKGELKRFYRTGDIVFRDKDGDYLFCGRKDSQLQIQGFRVELSEIEKHTRDFLGITNMASLGFTNENGTVAIALFLENNDKIIELKEYLFTKLPSYMIPERILNLKEFPKSAGGKVNKKELLKYL
jgi:D-alanine--poly(phosphoribitol) ligase subunit 1